MLNSIRLAPIGRLGSAGMEGGPSDGTVAFEPTVQRKLWEVPY
jgi:hypothetical protein